MAASESYAGPERRSEPQRSGLQRGLKPFFGLLRWIGDHVRGFHAAVGVYLVLGLSLVLAAVLLFGAMAALTTRGVTHPFDRAVLLRMNALSSPWLDGLALEITALGSGWVMATMVLIASTFLWLSRHRYSAVLLWVALLGSGLLSSTLKLVFDRPRPDVFEWRVPFAPQSSFPSGHSTMVMAVYLTLAYLVVRLEPTRALRRLTLAAFGATILLVGLSRVYLGVHYPSDVIAGFVAGFAWAVVCALGIEAVRYFRRRRPEVAAVERDLDRPPPAL
jgi:undecaprenyl-diphosphatase